MSENKRRKRLCMMTTIPWSMVMLCRGLFPFLIENDWDVSCVSGDGEDSYKMLREQGVQTVRMPLVRNPSPLKDLYCLFRLWWFFIFNRFDVIHVSTPKAMLLGTIAAFLAFQPNRVITMRGRAYENLTGLKRKLYICLDHLCYKLTKRVIPICRELGEIIVADGCNPDKIRFLGPSSNGINSDVFKRTASNIDTGCEIRSRLGIAADDIVILSVCRLRRDKGVNELVAAFGLLNAPAGRKLHLVLLGPRETHFDALDSETELALKENDRIHTPGNQNDPVPWYAMSDVFAFPTYREGFGNVAIEASAMELPVVASDIMGPRESVVNNVTGLLVPAQSIQPLAEALQKLIDEPETMKQMGLAGRQRAVKEFQPSRIWKGILGVYDELTPA